MCPQADGNHHQTCKFKGVTTQPSGDTDTDDYRDDNFADREAQCAHEVTTAASLVIETPETYMRDTHNVISAIMEERAHRFRNTEEESQGWMNSTRAELFFGGVIIANAVFLGIETDHGNSSEFELDWYLVEILFLFIFTVELIMRLMTDRKKFVYKGWNLFDLFLVITGILDTCVLTPVLVVGVSSGGSQVIMVDIFGVMRLARLARILRILKVLRFFRELMLLMRSIAGTMRAIVWSILLLILVLYVTAIFMTKLVGKDEELLHHEKTQRYFGSMVKTMFTLYQLITLEGWNQVARDMMAKDALGFSISIFFMVFVMFTNLTLLNLVTGIIFETVVKISNQDERDQIELEEKARLKRIDALHAAFSEIDADQDGVVTLSEFRDALRAPSGTLRTELERLGVGALSAEELFILLDYDNSGALTSEEFVFGFREATGSASAKQLLGIEGLVQKMWDSTSEQSGQCSESIKSLEKRLWRVEVLMEQFLAVSIVRKNRLAKAELLFMRATRKNPSNSVIL